ncbi:hypothetical protein [Chitiniphilus shinanonensis]|uniref:hypothetical protein n=1 Tax=Chitiniphilus shinanonensis TaxID=553088 RepID=UPI00302A289E
MMTPEEILAHDQAVERCQESGWRLPPGVSAQVRGTERPLTKRQRDAITAVADEVYAFAEHIQPKLQALALANVAGLELPTLRSVSVSIGLLLAAINRRLDQDEAARQRGMAHSPLTRAEPAPVSRTAV